MEALPDLDRIIELDPSTPHALTLRGQIRAQTGNKEGACGDFKKAKEIGDKEAEKYLNQFCGNETLVLDWPESEGWKVGSNQEDEKRVLIEMIHTSETLEKWTEMGTMMSMKGTRNLSIDKAMNLLYEQARQRSAEAKLTFLEKDENSEYPWIMFTIESPKFKNDKTPESQLWYVVQGKAALYMNFWAIKRSSISMELRDKWSTFFKTGRITQK
jgi:hypothetical protein